MRADGTHPSGRREHHPALNTDDMDGVEVVHAPTEDPEDPASLEEWGKWLDHPQSWMPNATRYPDKFAHVFTSIAESPGSVLVHCAGGRDRTGMVVAMLLSLADVEHRAIVADYERGFRGASAHRAHGLAYDPSTGGWAQAEDLVQQPEEIEQALTDRRPVLLDWLRSTDVAAYLRDAGVGADQVSRLRRLLGP